jgi:diaminopimelate decarboxylase
MYDAHHDAPVGQAGAGVTTYDIVETSCESGDTFAGAHHGAGRANVWSSSILRTYSLFSVEYNSRP